MVAGDPVLQAVDPAGILRDVATDAADHLTGRIGRVVETISRNRTGHPAVDHAGLNGDALVLQIEIKNPAHAAGHHQQSLLIDQSAS